MGLVVNTNTAAFNTTRVLRRSTLALNKSLERLSSGLRINRAADDAAGLAIAEGLRSQVRGFKQAQRNSQDGISLVQTAEGALSETTNIIQRIRELAVQSANGTQTAATRASLQGEVAQLLTQIDDIAARTTFNGVILLNGSVASLDLQSGINAAETTTVTLGDARAITLGISTADISTVGGATAAITASDAALTIVTTLRGGLGATQNRLEFTINTLGIQVENSLASESAIRDADIAQETIAFTRNQILVSAGTSILAQANIVPQQALQLLG